MPKNEIWLELIDKTCWKTLRSPLARCKLMLILTPLRYLTIAAAIQINALLFLFFLQWSIVEFLIFGHSKWQNRMLNACFGQLNSTLYMQATQVTYVKRIVKHSLWLFRTNKHRLRKPTSAWLNTDWIHKQLSTKITIKTKSILFGLKLWLFNC